MTTMSELTIKTNNKPYPLVCFHELPPTVMLDFDYIDDEDDMYTERFVKYRGHWYDTRDVQGITVSKGMVLRGCMGWNMTVEPDHPFADWSAVISDSYFSGVLFKFVGEDLDQVVCGTYFS